MGWDGMGREGEGERDGMEGRDGGEVEGLPSVILHATYHLVLSLISYGYKDDICLTVCGVSLSTLLHFSLLFWLTTNPQEFVTISSGVGQGRKLVLCVCVCVINSSSITLIYIIAKVVSIYVTFSTLL